MTEAVEGGEGRQRWQLEVGGGMAGSVGRGEQHARQRKG